MMSKFDQNTACNRECLNIMCKFLYISLNIYNNHNHNNNNNNKNKLMLRKFSLLFIFRFELF